MTKTASKLKPEDLSPEQLWELVYACAVIVYVVNYVEGKKGLKKLIAACKHDQALYQGNLKGFEIAKKRIESAAKQKQIGRLLG
jgi:hypothetical protein